MQGAKAPITLFKEAGTQAGVNDEGEDESESEEDSEEPEDELEGSAETYQQSLKIPSHSFEPYYLAISPAKVSLIWWKVPCRTYQFQVLKL